MLPAFTTEGLLQHQTVLLEEAVTALLGDRHGHYVDATFGYGGHSRLLLNRLSDKGRITAFDKDLQAIQANTIRDSRLHLQHHSYTGIQKLPNHSIDGILMDLGVSSPQLEQGERGFSFQQDGPLDMRMDTSQTLCLQTWLNTVDEATLKKVIRDYGEERYAPAIAKAIVLHRKQAPLTNTAMISKIIAGVVKTRQIGKNPSTRTFQALRIFINNELEELKETLDSSLQVLRPGGRLVIISFHSLEDRMVKQFIYKHSRTELDREQPLSWMTKNKPLLLKNLGKIKPTIGEVTNNPRARSAILRIAERTENPCK